MIGSLIACIVCFFVGECTGAVVMALCAASDTDEDKEEEDV